MSHAATTAGRRHGLNPPGGILGKSPSHGSRHVVQSSLPSAQFETSREAYLSSTPSDSSLEKAAAAPSPLFDWSRQWYPMMVLEDADPKIPHATQLLGKDLVIWRDKEGQWRYFQSHEDVLKLLT